MKIYLTDQKKNFKKHLDFFKNQSVMKYDKENLKEKITTIEIESKFSKIDLRFFFDYKIFPSNIISHLGQWNLEKREMKIGDTIVQQTFIPPIKSLSQKVIFAVRINEIIDEPNKKGFSYETIEGHVEKGISRFTIEESNGKSIFKILTFSKPGNFLTSLIGPVFSVPYQTYCTNKALINVKKQIENK